MRSIGVLMFIVLAIIVGCDLNSRTNNITFNQLNEEYLESFTEEQLSELEIIDLVGQFSVTTIKDKELTFGKNSKKPTVLFLFATWCPSCKEAFTDVTLAFNENLQKEINLVAVGRGHTKEELTSCV